MHRRTVFKLATSVIFPTLGVSSEKKSTKTTGKSLLIIGAGFAGLSIAKALRNADASIDVTVIEKRSLHMTSALSNGLLGGLDKVSLQMFMGDYFQPASHHGYRFVQAEAIAIERKSKRVQTATQGYFYYDILVLSPGISYDYKKQFPSWSPYKISQVSAACPAALLPDTGHIALQRQLENMYDGNVIVVLPVQGKFTSSTVAYERISMIAYYLKSEKIKGKVIVLDSHESTGIYSKAFEEAWKSLYKGFIDYRSNVRVRDIDILEKSITYTDRKKKIHTENYEVCNLMPTHTSSPVIALAGIERDSLGYASMRGCGFQSKTDASVYVIGDATAHQLPPTGEAAIWAAHRATDQIIAGFNGKKFDPKKSLPQKDATVSYAFVGGKPEEAIMMKHTFFTDASGLLKSKGILSKPKDAKGKYRSQSTAVAMRRWFDGAMDEMFS